MAEYKYSIIVPHYNDLDNLNKLLLSIPERDDIQIIIIDDRSQIAGEKIAEVCKGHSNVILKWNKDGKKGAGACRNIGIKHAAGEWLLFADADDTFVKDAFKHLDESVHQEADLYFFSPVSIEEDTGKESSRHILYKKLVKDYIKSPSPVEELKLKYDFAAIWSKLISHELVKEKMLRFDETMWANDVMFSAYVSRSAKKIMAYDVPIYCITRKTGTLTTDRNEKEFKERFNVYVRKYVYLRENLSTEEWKKISHWPGGKIILAWKRGYGLPMVKYIWKTYQNNHISLLSIYPGRILHDAYYSIYHHLKTKKYIYNK